jgi:hypothetical protein
MKTELVRMITNWEQSGQGDGGTAPPRRRPAASWEDNFSDDDDDTLTVVEDLPPTFGNLTGRSAQAMDQRENFLDGRNPYLLIFWEVADKHQLLSVALQRLSDSVSAADASSAPATVVMRRPNKNTSRTPEDDATAALIGDLGKSVSRYDANCNLRQLALQIQDVQTNKREYGLMHSRCKDPSERLYLTEQMTTMTNQIKELEEQKRKLARIAEKYD